MKVENKPISPFNCGICGLPIEQCKCKEKLGKIEPSKSVMIGYADFGSHGKIFEFCGGLVGNRYPHLLHIYSEKVTPDLKRVRIILDV